MISSQQSPIDRIIASVFRLHGDERDQWQKRREYLSWLENVRVKTIPAVPFRESKGDE